MVHNSEPTLIASRDDNEHSPLDIATDTQSRLKALLRFILFVALAAGCTLLALVVVKKVFKSDVDVDGHLSLQTLLVGECVLAIVNAALPTAIMIGATRESLADFGWARSRHWRDLGIGLLAGLGSMTALLATMSWLGGYSFGKVALTSTQVMENAAISVVIFSMVSLSEEGSMRGYALVQLSRAISFWPAALGMSALFLVLHLVHQGETAIGLAQVGLMGLILAYSFRRSGALWYALGAHASWDFAQSFLFGVPDSGVSMPGALLHPTFHGPVWLTGGSAGPEGSALVFPALAVLACVTHFALSTRRSVS